MHRAIVSSAAVEGRALLCWDISQANTQSTYALKRRVYTKMTRKIRAWIEQATGREPNQVYAMKKQLYGLSEYGPFWHHAIKDAFRSKGMIYGALDATCLLYSDSGLKIMGVRDQRTGR
ncbi:hypothetical protein FVE85_4430 [Porphyridium purpureum]|uniref:Uncharacterized protein n=1 Tax=Porphyridium purpureum TaxID=35688 RepID=A0A5J4YK45_PORPP|nr:hypothetical protein FVE85_4430 [Porphyridium purpureum]|eukprot:POR1119..scf297_16